jgi:hypothetical protein
MTYAECVPRTPLVFQDVNKLFPARNDIKCKGAFMGKCCLLLSQLLSVGLCILFTGCASTLSKPDQTVPISSRMSIAQAQEVIRQGKGANYVTKLTRSGTALKVVSSDYGPNCAVPFPALAASTEQGFYGVIPGDGKNPYCVGIGGYESTPPAGKWWNVRGGKSVCIEFHPEICGGWLGFQTRQAAQEFADAIHVLSHATLAQLRIPEDPAVQAAFAKAAQLYRAAPEKPALPEEARKYKVQAADAVGRQQYDDAVDLYESALKIAPWWPEGHFNCALLMSNVGDYIGAVREMNRYLALTPEAADARQARDKIYLWEGKLH